MRFVPPTVPLYLRLQFKIIICNFQRSALAYRNEFGGATGRDDFRRDIFRGVHSLGVSTASTTSRSTTKTSSSPYRSDGFYGTTLPHHLHQRGKKIFTF